jgi:5-methylcytosine-specific restriction endonuclease McrA
LYSTVSKKEPPSTEQLAQMSSERRWYWTHLEEGRKRAAERQKEHWRVMKQQVFEKLGGAKCVRCGCDDETILEVNHIDGDKSGDVERVYGNASRTAWLYGDIISNRRTIKDLNVMCRVCNNAEWAERKSGKQKGHHKIVWIPA